MAFHDAIAARDALAERRRVLVLRRLKPQRAVTVAEIARLLELPGGVVGIRAVLAQLAERGLAHEMPDGWCPGPPPPSSSAPLVIPETHRPAREPWLRDLAARVPSTTAPRPESSMSAHPHDLRARVLADLTKHAGAKGVRVGEMADRIGMNKESLSRFLNRLREAGWVRLEGQRSTSRWFPSSSHPPPTAARTDVGAGVSSGRGPVVDGDDLAIVRQALDLLGVPEGSMAFRMGVVVGLARGVRG